MSTLDALRYVTTKPGETVFGAAERAFGSGVYVDVLARVDPAVPALGTVATTASGPGFRVYPPATQVPSKTSIPAELPDFLAAFAQTLDGGESTLARLILGMADRLKLPGSPSAVDDARGYLTAYLDGGSPPGGYATVARGCVELLAAIAEGKARAGAWLLAATSPTRPAVTMGRDSLACGTGRTVWRGP